MAENGAKPTFVSHLRWCALGDQDRHCFVEFRALDQRCAGTQVNPAANQQCELLMDADDLLAALDCAVDSALEDQTSRAERLVLAVWWLVDRFRHEMQIPAEEAAEQVGLMARIAVEESRGRTN
jgi:hypothetical protein